MESIEGYEHYPYIMSRVNRYNAVRGQRHLTDDMLHEAWVAMELYKHEHGVYVFNEYMDLRIKRACQHVEVANGNSSWHALNGNAEHFSRTYPDGAKSTHSWTEGDEVDGWAFIDDAVPQQGGQPELSGEMVAALATLTDKQREAFTLHADGMGPQEIANIMWPGVKDGRTYARQAYARAIKKLRKELT